MFSLILESVDEPAFVVGADGLIRGANVAAQEAAGFRASVGRPLGSVLTPRSDPGQPSAESSAWLHTGVERRRATLRTVEGQAKEVDVSVAPMAEAEGASLVVAAAVDGQRCPAQERDRTLRQLAEAEALAGLGSWEWDVVTNEVSWSAQMCRLAGVDPEEAEPSFEAYEALVHPDDREAWLADVEATYASDEAFTTEHRLVRPDGSIRHVRARAAVVRDDGGQPLRLLGSVIDVTEQRELQRRKDEFVGVVSHELRTPLTSISGALGLLAGGGVGELPPRATRMIEIASSNTERLVRLINDILDLERIESGRVGMVREDLDLERLVGEAAAVMGPLADEAGVHLVEDVEPCQLVGDPDRLQQVLTNLISNAIKFSPADQVVRVAARRENDEIIISVTDRGRGIPSDNLDRIFERFEQVDSSDSRQKGGTGLGLPICRSIVEEHGGRIWAESELGQGTTVIARLPADTPLAGAPVDTPGGPLVLVCDDEVDARAIAQATLEANGYRVVTARNGDEALQRAIDEHPDAIVLDLIMPGRDGWQTAAALQQDPATAHIPVIIFSALPYTEAPAPSAHITAWVDKAMIDADLVGAVSRAVGSSGEDGSDRSKVLLVEDDPDLASVLAEALRKQDVAVWVARTGHEAERLVTSIEPHALVLDLLLPDRDGFAVVDAMRQHQRVRRTPLLVYTALDLDPAQREELRLGPTEYYTKGRVSPQQLEERILDLLRSVVPRSNPAPPAGG